MDKDTVNPENVNPHFQHPEAFGLSTEDMKRIGLYEGDE